ncbi:hypothetical protein B296_00002735 [Ensete ventricosum]|uniref:Retrotransposon gag domain-containing protein n=1 Tax=Ensete ventricosum TaxID=4639 RepID=A0A427AXJ5_ENSVE|nr:hypothetical protein B296_00002735 [Ensete ventricosum]
MRSYAQLLACCGVGLVPSGGSGTDRTEQSFGNLNGVGVDPTEHVDLATTSSFPRTAGPLTWTAGRMQVWGRQWSYSRPDTGKKEVLNSRGEVGENSKGGSPFTPEIQAKPLPATFRLPALKPYDGHDDPTEHIATFHAQMTLYDTSDALMCRAFPTTLRGPARIWYSRLKPTSIPSFDLLAKEFELNFLASARLKPTTASLLGMAQGSDERLSQFVGRFTSQVQGIPYIHPSLAIQAFLTGLRPSRFFWSLIERPPMTLPEMLQQVHQYMVAETLVASRWEETKRPRREQSRGHPTPPPKRREDRLLCASSPAVVSGRSRSSARWMDPLCPTSEVGCWSGGVRVGSSFAGKLRLASWSARMESAKELPEQPALSPCWKKKAPDAGFLANVKDHFDQFVGTSIDRHRICLKKTIRGVGDFVKLRKQGKVPSSSSSSKVVTESNSAAEITETTGDSP